jgi:hypothetical protein
MHSSAQQFSGFGSRVKVVKKRMDQNEELFVIFEGKGNRLGKQGSGRRFMIQKDSNQRIPTKKKLPQDEETE